MKKKELKKLAEEIATYERIVQTTQDKNERAEAQNKIIRLSEKVYNMEDMLALDVLLQDILAKNNI